MTEVGALRTRLSFEDRGSTRGIKGFRDDLKGLRSEMNVARSAGQQYMRNVDGLSKQSDVLSRRLRTQQQQVMMLRDRYDQASRAKNRNQKQINDLSRQYNNAIASMNRTKTALEGVNRELAAARSPFTAMGEQLTSVGGKMQTVGREMSSFGRSYTMRVTAPIIAGGVGMIKAASDYESAFAGVRKTTDMTESQYSKLSRSFRDMALEIPAAATEIARVGEAAGQLGIQNENILGFTRVMIDLGVATDMSSDQAAMALARLANITGMAQTDFDRLGSAIVDLGNNSAATESEISEMALRIAGAGTQINMSEADIIGFAGALASVGIRAEAGGTAISKLMIEIASDVDQGGERLQEFARIAGMSVEDFRKAFEEDAATAIFTFLGGLGDLSEEGESAFQIIDELGLSEIRLRDTILRSSSARDLANNSLRIANEAWDENVALTNEAEERYATTASQLQILKNRFMDNAITLGQALIPALFDAIEAAEPLFQAIESGAKSFSEMDKEQQQTILQMIVLAAAIGPASIVLGGLTTTAGGFLKVVGSVSTALGKVGGKGLIGRVGLLGVGATGPVGLAIAGIGGLAWAAWELKDAFDDGRESNLQYVETLRDQYSALAEATTRYEELRKETGLTTEQIAEFLDLRTQMENTRDVDALALLEEKFSNLAKESGITEEQLEELLSVNDRIIEQAPEVADAHTKHGNAVADVGTALQEMLDKELEIATKEAEIERSLWAEEREKNIKKATAAEAEREKILDRIDFLMSMDLHNRDQMQSKLNELLDTSVSYLATEQEQNDARKKATILEEALRTSGAQQLETLRNQLGEQSDIIAAVEEHKQKGNELNSVYLELLLKNLNINEQGQKGVDLANDQLGKLKEQRDQLQQKLNKEGDQTGELQNQVNELNNQIRAYEDTLSLIDREIGGVKTATDEERKRKNQIQFVNDTLAQAAGIHNQNTSAQGRTNRSIEEGKGKASDMNKELGKNIDKDVKVKDNGTAREVHKEAEKKATKNVTLRATWSNLTSSLTAGVRAAMKNIPGFATGTDSAPGGLAMVGEEGYELARYGNRWAMLDFGLTHLPRGTQVFTHDESKNILSAINKIPAYATGVSPNGEADRIVNRLNAQQNPSSNDGRVLTLLKDIADGVRAGQVVVVDQNALGKAVTPVVTKEQERAKGRRKKRNVK